MTINFVIGKRRIKATQEIQIDASRSFVPIHTALTFHDDKGNSNIGPYLVDANWEKQGDVYLPVHIQASRPGGVAKWDLRMKWANVNETISDDQFDYKHLGAAAGTQVLDRRTSAAGVVVDTIGGPGAKQIAREFTALNNVESTHNGSMATRILIVNVVIIAVLGAFIGVRKWYRQI